MDIGAWQAIVHGVAKSQTQLSDYHSLTENINEENVIQIETAWRTKGYNQKLKYTRVLWNLKQHSETSDLEPFTCKFLSSNQGTEDDTLTK